MPTNYKCDYCKKTFRDKTDYTRHLNAKTACISLKDLVNKVDQTVNEKLSNVLENSDSFSKIVTMGRDIEISREHIANRESVIKLLLITAFENNDCIEIDKDYAHPLFVDYTQKYTPNKINGDKITVPPIEIQKITTEKIARQEELLELHEKNILDIKELVGEMIKLG